MKNKHQRIRLTIAVQRHAENHKILLDALRAAGRMTLEEICEVLAMSRSGGRKYLNELREFGVLHTVDHIEARRGFQGFAVFAIASEEKAAAFLDDIALPPDFRAAAPRPERIVSPPGINVHMMKDDVRFELKRSPVVVRRDPLVAALFGQAVA